MQLNKNVFLQNTYISYLHKQNPIIHNVFLSFKSMLEIFLCQCMCTYHIPLKGFMTFMVYMYPKFLKVDFQLILNFFNQCKQLSLLLFLVLGQTDQFEWCPHWNNQNAGKNIVIIIKHNNKNIIKKESSEVRNKVRPIWQQTAKVIFLRFSTESRKIWATAWWHAGVGK